MEIRWYTYSCPNALFPSLGLNNKPTLFPDAHESMGN
jgi:hypothetical protein